MFTRGVRVAFRIGSTRARLVYLCEQHVQQATHSPQARRPRPTRELAAWPGYAANGVAWRVQAAPPPPPPNPFLVAVKLNDVKAVEAGLAAGVDPNTRSKVWRRDWDARVWDARTHACAQHGRGPWHGWSGEHCLGPCIRLHAGSWVVATCSPQPPPPQCLAARYIAVWVCVVAWAPVPRPRLHTPRHACSQRPASGATQVQPPTTAAAAATSYHQLPPPWSPHHPSPFLAVISLPLLPPSQPSALSKTGYSALHVAARFGATEAAHVLMAAGADTASTTCEVRVAGGPPPPGLLARHAFAQRRRAHVYLCGSAHRDCLPTLHLPKLATPCMCHP